MNIVAVDTKEKADQDYRAGQDSNASFLFWLSHLTWNKDSADTGREGHCRSWNTLYFISANFISPRQMMAQYICIKILCKKVDLRLSYLGLFAVLLFHQFHDIWLLSLSTFRKYWELLTVRLRSLQTPWLSSHYIWIPRSSLKASQIKTVGDCWNQMQQDRLTLTQDSPQPLRPMRP